MYSLRTTKSLYYTIIRSTTYEHIVYKSTNTPTFVKIKTNMAHHEIIVDNSNNCNILLHGYLVSNGNSGLYILDKDLVVLKLYLFTESTAW